MEACKECQSLSWTGLDQSQPFHPGCTRHGTNAANPTAPDLNAETLEKGIVALRKLANPQSVVVHRAAGDKLYPLQNVGWMRFGSGPRYDLVWPTRPLDDIPSLISRMESLFTVGEDSDSATSPTGEEFVQFTIGGLTGMGEAGGILATSKEAALKYFWAEFARYANAATRGCSHMFTLYWREKPNFLGVELKPPNHVPFEGRADDDGIRHYWQIWSRFLITNNPPLAKEA